MLLWGHTITTKSNRNTDWDPLETLPSRTKIIYPGSCPTRSPEDIRGQAGTTALRQPIASTPLLKLLKDTWKQPVDIFVNPLRQFLLFIWAFLLPDAILSFGFKVKITVAWKKASPNATAHWTDKPQLCSTWFLHCSRSSPEEMLQARYGIYTVNTNLSCVNGWYKSVLLHTDVVGLQNISLPLF